MDYLPDNVYHHFHLKEPSKVMKLWQYSCPHHYVNKWKILLQQHLEKGLICPSSSPYCSPAFIVTKKDPNALPQWVNNYCNFNNNTVPDIHPLPHIDNVLADCTKEKF